MAKPKPEPHSPIAANLARAMQESPDLGSQVALSKRSKVGQTTIGRILRGEATPGADVLRKLAKALQMPASALLGEAASGGSHVARFDPAKVVVTTRAINRILDRRHKGLTLDLSEPLDAELFVEAYAECELMPEPSEADMIVVVADLMLAREAKRGRESKQVGGLDRGQDRKARTG